MMRCSVMDIVAPLLQNGALPFYVLRFWIIVFLHPTEHELTAVLEGSDPLFLRLLATRGLVHLLPQLVQRIYDPNTHAGPHHMTPPPSPLPLPALAPPPSAPPAAAPAALAIRAPRVNEERRELRAAFEQEKAETHGEKHKTVRRPEGLRDRAGTGGEGSEMVVVKEAMKEMEELSESDGSPPISSDTGAIAIPEERKQTKRPPHVRTTSGDHEREHQQQSTEAGPAASAASAAADYSALARRPEDKAAVRGAGFYGQRPDPWALGFRLLAGRLVRDPGMNYLVVRVKEHMLLGSILATTLTGLLHLRSMRKLMKRVPLLPLGCALTSVYLYVITYRPFWGARLARIVAKMHRLLMGLRVVVWLRSFFERVRDTAFPPHPFPGAAVPSSGERESGPSPSVGLSPSGSFYSTADTERDVQKAVERWGRQDRKRRRRRPAVDDIDEGGSAQPSMLFEPNLQKCGELLQDFAWKHWSALRD
ncbi:unnamed protein product [Vitrella brassicaformis CCMP3155]|uniref:Uncharacterized protein n=2 Tax=Vitrella brassicaformis TaxID=1169539 RepID=A0A0G4GRC0_VITBC|nr:unnamed protein product [Vitrella brassicaformis CCMP3155]|eukprot:CEM33073.1 unnamed protein product [Vitrella brassicaformis CCMP3155]